jgi:DNA-binding response OmpR family regulator
VKGVVRRLRAKLEPDPAHPQYIITEPHLGYRLNDSL